MSYLKKKIYKSGQLNILIIDYTYGESFQHRVTFPTRMLGRDFTKEYLFDPTDKEYILKNQAECIGMMEAYATYERFEYTIATNTGHSSLLTDPRFSSLHAQVSGQYLMETLNKITNKGLFVLNIREPIVKQFRRLENG